MEILAEECCEFTVTGNFDTKEGCFPLETRCSGSGYACPVSIESGAGGVWRSPVCWAVVMVCGLVCAFKVCHSEPSDGEEASATHTHIDTKIMKFKVQVKSRS